MRMTLAYILLLVLTASFVYGGNAKYSAMSYDDFWLDKSSLAGKKIQLQGFATYAGDLLMMSKEFGNANFLSVDVATLSREARKNLINSCSPYCNIVVRGTVQRDMLGSIILKAEDVPMCSKFKF